MKLSESPKKPKGFEKELANLQSLKTTNPEEYKNRINHLRLIAFDPSCVGRRNEFWAGWEAADFEDLFLEIGE